MSLPAAARAAGPDAARLVAILLSAAMLLVAGLLDAQPATGLTDTPPPAIELRAPDEVRQGEVLRLQLRGPVDIDDVRIELQTPDGRRRFTRGFAGRDAAWHALLGIDSTDAAGESTLTVRVLGPAGPVVRERNIMIRPAEFRSERIALNDAMSSLRRTEDPRRAEQSRVLWELLHDVDPAAVYHTGRLRLPVAEFRRTSAYGDRREFAYSDGRSARSIHYGVDFAAPTGTAISAPAGGRVAMARDRIITGGTVVLEHLPGVFTVYYHLDTISVTEDDYVVPGARIGTVGSTGLSTGPHLHWELRVAGAAVNPELLLERPLIEPAEQASEARVDSGTGSGPVWSAP